MIDMIDLAAKLNERFQGAIQLSTDGQAIYAEKGILPEVMKALKDEFQFNRLSDITSVDQNDYLEVVYHLLNNEVSFLKVKVRLEKDSKVVPSIVSVWRYADSQEREAYDMMGIIFEGHGNLKRILCKDDFEGHPLLKSYKLNVVNRF